VCHVVQLAISHKKILGYLDGRIVPYRHCELVVKQHSAELQQPAWSLKKDALPVADLAHAQDCLRRILASAQCAEKGGVPMPNIKRLFRTEFGCELMETVFGYARLCDLLCSDAFSGICELRLQSSNYFVLPRARPERTATADVDTNEDVGPCLRWQPAVRRTFIHVEADMPRTGLCRHKSLPRDWKPNVYSEIEDCTRRQVPLTPRVIRRFRAARKDSKVDSSDEETTASDASPKDWAEVSIGEISPSQGSDDEDDHHDRHGIILPCLLGLERSHLRTPSPSPRRRESPFAAMSLQCPDAFHSSSCRTPSHSPRYHWRGETSPVALPAAFLSTSTSHHWL